MGVVTIKELEPLLYPFSSIENTGLWIVQEDI